MLHKFIAAVALKMAIGLGLATSAFAQAPATPAAPAVQSVNIADVKPDSKADANADGALTGDEYKTYLAVNGQPSPAKPKK